MITLERAKRLQYREVLVDSRDNKKWRVNGMVTRWKKDQDRISVPLKHGLYAYGHLTNSDFTDGECEYFTLESEMDK